MHSWKFPNVNIMLNINPSLFSPKPTELGKYNSSLAVAREIKNLQTFVFSLR